MQGSFEKKVQEKLDELRLTPSSPVWEKVELQLRPEKKRRRALLWFFLPVLLVAGGWWLVEQQSTNLQNPVATTTVTKQNDTAQHSLRQENKSKTVNGTTASAPEAKAGATLHGNKLETTNGTAQVTTIDVQSVRNTNTAKTNSSYKKGSLSAIVSKERKAVSQRWQSQNKMGKQYGNGDESIAAVRTAESVQAVATNSQTDAEKQNEKNIISADTISQQKTAELPKPTLLPPADSVKKKPAVAQQTWKGKLLFGAGWSNFIRPTNAANNLDASPAQTNSQPGSSGYIGAEQKHTKDISFSLGYALERSLTSQLTFLGGLQYAYYSTRQRLGLFKSSSTTVRFQNDALKVSGYYSSTPVSNDSATTYTNRLHVVELPIHFKYKPSSLPLYVSAGFSYGRLLSSNVLTYDPATGVYYQNKQNNRKDFFSLSGTLQYQVVKNAGWTLSVGPAVQYNLVPLQKTSSTASHLLFAGLQGSIEF